MKRKGLVLWSLALIVGFVCTLAPAEIDRSNLPSLLSTLQRQFHVLRWNLVSSKPLGLNQRRELVDGSQVMASTKFFTSIPRSGESNEAFLVWVDDFPLEEIQPFLVSSRVGLRFLLGSGITLDLIKSSLKPVVNQRIFFVDKVSFMVSEYYDINEHPVHMILGQLEWKRDHFSYEPSTVPDFLERRSNFHGLVFRCIVDVQAPYLVVKRSKNLTQSQSFVSDSGDEMRRLEANDLIGMFRDFMMIIESQLNVSCQYIRRLDGKWGSQNEDGSWTGMISSIRKNEADIIATSLTLKPERFIGIDYLWPIGTETYALFIKRTSDSEELAWKTFFLPFSYGLWQSLCLCALLSVTLLKLFEFVHSESVEKAKGMYQNLEDSFLYYWLILCSYFGKSPPHFLGDYKTSFKILIFVLFLFGNMMFIGYRASLTSELSNRVHKKPFDSLDDLLRLDYSLIARRGGASEELFRSSKEGVYKDLFEKLIQPNPETALYGTIEEGLEELMSRSKGVYYYHLESVFTLDEFKCKVQTPWISKYPNLLAMAVAKRSPYFEFLQYLTIRHLERGTVHRLNKKWQRAAPDCPGTVSVALGPEKLIALFALMIIGMSLAVVIFGMECCVGMGLLKMMKPS